jgi:hypothetical protein
MPSTRTNGHSYIALGTTSLPYFLTRSSLEELSSALTSAGGLTERGQLHSEIEVFDSCGAKVEDPFAPGRHGSPRKPASDQERAVFQARCAAVLATLAALAAEEIGGQQSRSLNNARGVRCNCCLCWLTGKRC